LRAARALAGATPLRVHYWARQEAGLPTRSIPGLIATSDVEFVVVFNPETPDRTAAIEGRGPSPLPALRESADLVQRMGAAHLLYPCNTAHYFIHRATPTDLPLRVPLVDLIGVTVEAVAAAAVRRVGLLATTGTILTGLYQDGLRAQGLEVLVPSTHARPAAEREVGPDGRMLAATYARHGARAGARLEPRAFAALAAEFVDRLGEQQGLVMETIVGVLGVKAGHTTGLAAQLIEEAARRLADRGAEAFVLGCTELPLVLTGDAIELAGRVVPLIDPTRVAAARLRALPGSHGIAGGLGPEATIDLLEKLSAPPDFTALQRDILRATVEQLGARRDQDHLKMFAVATRDPIDAARRLAQAGAEFLVLAESAAGAGAAVEAATRLPVVVARRGTRIGAEVVRRAASSAVHP
jgi:aspartate/glutamate racemase